MSALVEEEELPLPVELAVAEGAAVCTAVVDAETAALVVEFEELDVCWIKHVFWKLSD